MERIGAVKRATATYRGQVADLRAAIRRVLGDTAWSDVLVEGGRLMWTHLEGGKEAAYLYGRPVGEMIECEWQVVEPPAPEVVAVPLEGHLVWVDSKHTLGLEFVANGLVALLHGQVLAMINAGTWAESEGVVHRRYGCWPTEEKARVYLERQAAARVAELMDKFEEIMALTPLRLRQLELQELQRDIAADFEDDRGSAL